MRKLINKQNFLIILINKNPKSSCTRTLFNFQVFLSSDKRPDFKATLPCGIFLITKGFSIKLFKKSEIWATWADFASSSSAIKLTQSLNGFVDPKTSKSLDSFFVSIKHLLLKTVRKYNLQLYWSKFGDRV